MRLVKHCPARPLSASSTARVVKVGIECRRWYVEGGAGQGIRPQALQAAATCGDGDQRRTRKSGQTDSLTASATVQSNPVTTDGTPPPACPFHPSYPPGTTAATRKPRLAPNFIPG